VSWCRYGMWADWEAPYLTLNLSYDAAQIRVLLHNTYLL